MKKHLLFFVFLSVIIFSLPAFSCQKEIIKSDYDKNVKNMVIKVYDQGGLPLPQGINLSNMPDYLFFGDGTVIYSNLNEQGNQILLKGKISQDNLKKLIEEIIDQGFFELEDSYKSSKTLADYPGQAIELNLKDKTKKVIAYDKKPKEFNKIQNTISQSIIHISDSKPYRSRIIKVYVSNLKTAAIVEAQNSPTSDWPFKEKYSLEKMNEDCLAESKKTKGIISIELAEPYAEFIYQQSNNSPKVQPIFKEGDFYYKLNWGYDLTDYKITSKPLN